MKIPFLGLPDHPQAKVALLPIPLEQTTTWLKGTGFAPLEILKVSPYLEFFEEETGLSPHQEVGFFTYPLEEFPFSLDEALAKVESLTSLAVTSHFLPILLGGEHTLTLGAIRALKKVYPDLKILHLDAHLDFRDTYLGTKVNHATVMRRIHELGIPILSVGIRAISEEEFKAIKEKRLSVIFAHEIYQNFPSVLRRIEDFLREGAIYLSLDMDALDPSLAPGVGTPEPGGLLWPELLSILKVLAKARVIGLDLVEVRPIPHYPFTEFLVGKIILKFTAYMAKFSQE